MHDLHVLSLKRDLRTMSVHVLTEDIPISEGTQIQSQVTELVNQSFQVAYATLQLECVDCEIKALYCDINGVTRLPQERVR